MNVQKAKEIVSALLDVFSLSADEIGKTEKVLQRIKSTPKNQKIQKMSDSEFVNVLSNWIGRPFPEWISTLSVSWEVKVIISFVSEQTDKSRYETMYFPYEEGQEPISRSRVLAAFRKQFFDYYWKDRDPRIESYEVDKCLLFNTGNEILTIRVRKDVVKKGE
jgi:hypothetical protein